MTVMTTASEIFDSIRIRVRTGELRPGEALPPVRELAVQLGVNRNTVASAYKKLVAAGIAVTNGRHGTTVKGADEQPEQEGSARQTALSDVSGGNPELSALPDVAALLKAVSPVPRTYGEPTINRELEQHGRGWFAPDAPGEFTLNMTWGAIDAIERLITGWLTSGEKIAVEEPCFLSSINTIRSLGYLPTGVAVDRDGLRPDALRAALEEGAQVVIITPRAHNPTGCSLSAERAAAIRALLADYPQVMVIVDDHFSLLSGEPYRNVIPADARNWAIVRSFSKFFGPDLRMAMVASSPETAQRLQQRLASGTHWVSHILQDMAGKAFSSAVVQKKVRHAAALYQDRRARFLSALAGHGIEIDRRYDGVNIWLPLENPAGPLVAQMAAKGWLVRPGSGFYLHEGRHAIRLTPAALSDRQLRDMARDLAETMAATGNAVSAA